MSESQLGSPKSRNGFVEAWLAATGSPRRQCKQRVNEAQLLMARLMCAFVTVRVWRGKGKERVRSDLRVARRTTRDLAERSVESSARLIKRLTNENRMPSRLFFVKAV